MGANTEMVLLDLFSSSPNKMLDDGATPLFDPPVIAVADASDPWFVQFKQIIGEFHWTPQEALALKAPSAKARSVVCWALPVAEPVRVVSRSEDRFPARSWAYMRTQADKVLTFMESGLVDQLEAEGFASLAPTHIPENVVEPRPDVGWSSRWSLRHLGFVAGLGTFGISGGLITRRGIAHRLGAVVTEAALVTTPRTYGDDPFAWCLRSSRGICGQCIKRCPVGSVGETVFDRNKLACFEHGRRIGQEGKSVYGWDGRYGCGLCQVGVPCEFTAPTLESSD